MRVTVRLWLRVGRSELGLAWAGMRRRGEKAGRGAEAHAEACGDGGRRGERAGPLGCLPSGPRPLGEWGWREEKVGLHLQLGQKG